MRLIIALFLICCASFISFASKAATRFDRLSLEDGLSQTTIRSTLQDKKGFLWIATGDGLNRYDGYSVKVFRHRSDDPDSVSHNAVSTLFEDSKGRLWVGTYGGLNRFDAKHERFIRFEASAGNTLSHNIITAIHEDAKGILWIGTSEGADYTD